MSERYKFSNPQGIYATTTTITNWIDLFTRKELAEKVTESLRFCQIRKGLIIHAWCLMPSHLHMIVSKKSDHCLSEIFRDFKLYTNESIIKCLNEINESRREWLLGAFAATAAPLKRVHHYKVWQDGNHPIELTSNEIIDQRLTYIHNNPVEAGLVWQPESWCYSSAIDYNGEKGYLKVNLIS